MPMQFYLFLLVNAVLFVRPAEIIPELEGAPIYEAVILAALAASASAILRHLTTTSLIASPLTVCMLGILSTVVLSALMSGTLGGTFSWGLSYFKILLYYLLLVAVVDTPSKLRRFMGWVGIMILALTTLALLQYHGVIELASLEAILQSEVDPESGELLSFPRLCGMGIFNDPNDLSVILVVGMMICLSRLAEKGVARYAWLAPLVVMGYALTLTYSRGGFIALIVALVSQFVGRYGLRKALVIVGPVLVLLVLLFGGRQTRFDLTDNEDTSQQRIRIWRDGIVLLWHSPIFGIGAGRYEEECGLVAHNSFIHAYTELGFIGGTLFLAAFTGPIWTLHRLRGQLSNRLLISLRPCVMACAVGMAGGMLSLSRVYNLTPYLILGIVAIYLKFTNSESPDIVPKLTVDLVARWLLFGMLFLVLTKAFIQIFAGSG